MELGLTRRNIARLVLVTWAIALAWLARRTFIQGDEVTAGDGTPRVAPAAQFFAVMARGVQIGQLNLTVDTLVDGVTVRELLVLDLPTRRATRQLTSGTEYSLSRTLRIRRIGRSLVGLGPQERLDAEMAEDSTFRVTQTESPFGVAGRTRLRFDPDKVLPVTMPFRLAHLGRLQVGAAVSLPLLDLDGGDSDQAIAIRVTAESTFVLPDSAVYDSAGGAWVAATMDTIHAWRIEHDTWGGNAITWVDAAGFLVRQNLPGGVSIERSAFEIVRDNYRVKRGTESQTWRAAVPGMVSLASVGRVPDTVSSTRQFLVESGDSAPWKGTRALPGGRQRLSGDTIVVRRRAVADTGRAPAATYLQPSWDIPSQDAAIDAAAIEAVAGARTAEDTVRRLTTWVSRQIVTDTGATGSPTALHALRNRRGAPEGKARLLAAMARARGLPARVVSGLAVFQDGSYSHVWTEVWQGGWSAADPTFGHAPASASLVRLSLGAGDRGIQQLLLAASARFLPLRTPR